MTQDNPLLAMMLDGDQVKKTTEAWMKSVPAGAYAHAPFAALITTSAIGLGIYSQMLGAMFGTQSDIAGSDEPKAPAKKTTAPKQAKPKPSLKVVSPVADDSAFKKPASLAKPDIADDLKMISGVGPKLEKVLNSLGIWKFEQISAWSKQEIDWVDDFLQFNGRIERDDWLKQAEKLAG